MLTAGNKDSTNRYIKLIKRAIRRIATLSKINICSKSHDLTLFKIAKKGGSLVLHSILTIIYTIPKRIFKIYFKRKKLPSQSINT